MTEIQDAAQTAFLFITAYYIGLYLAGTDNQVTDRFCIECLHRFSVFLQIVEHGGIADDTVLHYLPETGRYLTGRQCLQTVKVDENRIRLVKCPDEVLAQTMIHSHLAANGGVNIRQQAGRDLDKRNASHIGSGNEAA